MGGARPVRSFLSGKMRLIADLWRPLLQMAVRWFASRKLVSISLRRSDHIAMKNCVVRQQTVRLTRALQRTTGNSTTIEEFLQHGRTRDQKNCAVVACFRRPLRLRT